MAFFRMHSPWGRSFHPMWCFLCSTCQLILKSWRMWCPNGYNYWNGVNVISVAVLQLLYLATKIFNSLGTKVSLDTLKRRLHTVSSKYQTSKLVKDQTTNPLFKAEIHLAIPNVVMRPSLEDIQVRKLCILILICMEYCPPTCTL